MFILRAAHREISKAAQVARRFTSFEQVRIPCSRPHIPHPSSKISAHGPTRWPQASTGYASGLPQSVRLVEVGPRDGLQNEPVQVSSCVSRPTPAMRAVTSSTFGLPRETKSIFQVNLLCDRPGRQ